MRQLFTDDAGRTYLLIHGSPRAPLDEYLFPWLPESEFRAVLTYIRQDDLLVGHTHIPMLKVIEGRRIINPGSVGQPRDGDWRASYAIIDTSEEPQRTWSSTGWNTMWKKRQENNRRGPSKVPGK